MRCIRVQVSNLEDDIHKFIYNFELDESVEYDISVEKLWIFFHYFLSKLKYLNIFCATSVCEISIYFTGHCAMSRFLRILRSCIYYLVPISLALTSHEDV
jgi:hypothetical protein